jgi:hypothetical protein
MIRVVIGSAAAAVAMFVIGFFFFGLGLQNIAMGTVGDLEAAPIQQTLRANIARTGTYVVPGTRTAEQTRMFGTGPVALIHYNVNGQVARVSPGTTLKGLIFSFAVALAMGLGLMGIAGKVPDFRARAWVVVFVAVASAAFTHLGVPIYFPHGWGWYIYLFIADAVALAAAGIIVAWFIQVEPEAAVAGEAPAA